MDKFEQIIKQAVEGYEAPFNPQAWENVNNELGDSFDQLMKESTSGYEAPYNPAAWDAVSSQLGPTHSAWKWIGGSAAAVALIAVASFFLDNSETDNNQFTNHQSNEVVINNDNKLNDNLVVDVENDAQTENNTTVENDVNGEENNVLHPIDPDLNNSINVVEKEDGDADGIIPNQGSEDSDVADNETESNEGNGDVETNETETNGSSGTTHEDADFKVSAKFQVTSGKRKLTEVCQGDVCEFVPETIEKDLNYSWHYGDGSLSASKTGKHTFNRAGEFIVTLEIRNPANNKVVGSHSELILVNELPSTNFVWEQSNQAIPTVNFINQTEDASKIYWNIKGLKSSVADEFEYTFRKAGNYAIGLTATNENGCSKTIEKNINIDEDYNLLAPASFTPNGDGTNDNFIPLALTVMNVDFTMIIMDKSGKPVYTTQNAFEPWDGRYTEDNKMAENETSYIWRVVLTNSNGEQEVYQGQVFVIR